MNGKLRRVCACRAYIEAEPDELSIALAVAIHQRQPEHRIYRHLQEVADEKLPSLPVRLGTRALLRRLA